MSRLLALWDRLSDGERAQWTGVGLALAVFCVHTVIWSPWLIEDAAISYSYARNAAMGEGWVAFPGGEPVEGFSNPSWTALLASLQLLGINPWFIAPLLGLFFGATLLPMSFVWAREVTGDRGLLPVVAPLYLAVSPQFVVWCASGLENALWMWLLTLGTLVFLRELRTGGPPWSALPFALLAITRPEGALYVATVGIAGAVLGLRRSPRHLVRIAGFVAITASVWLAYEAYRWTIFGWPLPNTYYAKVEVGTDLFQPLAWETRDLRLAWPYLRGWGLWTAMGFLIPLMPLSATGSRGWRGQLGLFLGACLAMFLIPGAAWLTDLSFWPLGKEPESVVAIRVGLLLATATALPWVGLGRDGDEPRILAWTIVATLFVFVLYAGSDWMQGYRWIGMCVVPLAVLLADLAATLSTLRPTADPVLARRVAAAVVAVPIAAAPVHSAFLLAPTETTPFDVGRRVAYFNAIQERLHLDHSTVYDIDMGANMWWGGDRIVDVGGLIDVPFAHNHYEPAFIRSYLLSEQNPELMHAHANWMAKAGLQFQAPFKRDWIRLPHFVAGPGYFHIGNYLRRDVLLRKEWEGQRDRVVFGNQMTLTGLDTPSPKVHPGGILYVELGWKALREEPADFRAILVLSRDGEVHSWELPPAYDYVFPSEWHRTEVAHGYHSLDLPEDLPAGTWNLSLVVLSRNGVLPADRPASSPALARGEVMWGNRIEVASEADVIAAADARAAEVAGHADADRCEEAEQTLKAARRHLAVDHARQPWKRPELHTQVARCWARRAPTLDDTLAERAIARARDWDHRDPEVERIGSEMADKWQADGAEKWEQDKAALAYQAWRRALLADPDRPQLRRQAEEARRTYLGLVDKSESNR